MPLEAGDGFISGLVVTNPVNATDQVAQGDDHLRLIKTALKGSFPGVSGAVTATHTELNALDGITSSVAELNILDGVTVTAGEINDGARITQINQFTQLNTFASGIRLAGSPTESLSIDKTGTLATKRFSLFVGDGTGGSIDTDNYIKSLNTDLHFWAGAAGTTEVLLLAKSGVITTANTDASEFGYKGTPQNVQNGDYGIVLADCGKTIYKASGGAGETITIPANGTIAIPVGSIIRVVNNGGGTLSIAITTDTLTLAGAGTTGTRTLSDDGVAVLEKVASTEWFISGIGVS